MKRFSLISIAIASLAWAGWAVAETRPHYGGTLRIAIGEAPQGLDPATSEPAWLSQLVFENLVKLDERGRPQPSLATSWQADPGNQRWRFFPRTGVSFIDGTLLDANSVAASLRASNPQWKVLTAGESVMIETDSPDPMLPAELALPKNEIARQDGAKVSGTGPFAISEWDGQHALLSANDQYWQGRPFLDSIEIEFGKNSRDQMMALELGKSDVIEIEPEDIRRAQAGNNRVVMTSQPEELMALVFAHDPKSDDAIHLRNALAMSIDTAALNNVVFQGGGESSGALLPNWLSGYGFLFFSGASSETRLHKTQHSVSWTLSYDAADPIARIVSERILLNAKDAGITLQMITSGTADLRLVRVPLPSCDPETALTELAHDFEIAPPKFTGESASALYSAESALLQTHRVIPLLHLRTALATRASVHGLIVLPDGTVQLDNAWLSPEKP